MKCQWCGTENPSNLICCSVCGSELFKEEPAKDKKNNKNQSKNLTIIKKNNQFPDEEDFHTDVLSEYGVFDTKCNEDPEEELRTQFVRGEPKPIEVGKKMPKYGLPDSKLARDIDNAVDKFKIWLNSLGKFGRFSFYSNVLILLLIFFPWFVKPGVGFIPGLSYMGWINFLITGLIISTLAWRVRKRTYKVIPILLHIILVSLNFLFFVWIFVNIKNSTNLIDYEIIWGFYATSFFVFLSVIFGIFQIRYLW